MVGGTAAVLLGTASLATSSYSAYSSYSSGKSASRAQGRAESFNQVNDRFNLATQGHNSRIDELFQLQGLKERQAAAAQQHALTQNAAAWAQYEHQVNRKIVKQVAAAQITALDNEADAIDSRGRVSMRRDRQQGERLLGTQRAMTAKSGAVIGTGTPLDVAIETAGNIELAIQDHKYGSDLESKSLRDQSTAIGYERDLTLQLEQISSDYGIAKMLAMGDYERDIAGGRGRIDMLAIKSQSKIASIDRGNQAWGINNRPSAVPAMNAQNRATLISGASNTFGAAYSLNQDIGNWNAQRKTTKAYSGAQTR